GFDSQGNVLISYTDKEIIQPKEITCLCEIKAQDAGRKLLVLQLDNQTACIMGFLERAHIKTSENTAFEFQWNDTQLKLTDAYIELRCGKSLIRMTNKGEIISRGENITSHANQGNKIKGAFIKLN
ncbi:MAG: hypothetical protein PVI92_12445, partial [Chromatiales bacterium]